MYVSLVCQDRDLCKKKGMISNKYIRRRVCVRFLCVITHNNHNNTFTSRADDLRALIKRRSKSRKENASRTGIRFRIDEFESVEKGPRYYFIKQSEFHDFLFLPLLHLFPMRIHYRSISYISQRFACFEWNVT